MAKNKAVSPVSAARKILQLLRLDKKDVYAIYAFAVLAGLVQLALPLGIQSIIGFVMAGTISASIVVLIVLVLAAVLLNGLLQVRQIQVTEKIQQKIFVRYAFEYADRIPKLNIEKLDGYYLPELVNRFFDTSSLQKGIEKILLGVPAAIMQILFGVLLLSLYHPIFVGFGFTLLLLLFLILKFTMPAGFDASIEASNQKYATAGWLEEIARLVKTFKYAKDTSLNVAKTDKIVSKYLLARTTYFNVLLTQYWSMISFKLVITAAMLMVGAFLLVDQQINVGQFFAADIVILSVISSVEKLIGTLDKVYDVLTSVEKLSKITESDTETQGSSVLPDIIQGVSIVFAKVDFSYYNTNKVLQNISFSIQPGQKICIMGESGSGKSSILRILTGAYKNFEGSVLIENLPIGNYTLDSIRSQTGVLLNQQEIFEGTIWENLTMGNPAIKHTDVNDLIKISGLQNFISAQPKGFDTHLDPMGKIVSAEIKQTILLLRALIGKKRLLLLEDPINNISANNQAQIIDYIFMDKTNTTILTTSDKAVAQKSDCIIYLKDGTIKAIGTYNEVASIIS
jgi:ABC-type bacteriocin/lantibiotic exporter with double-glycine peptidase domain